MNGSNDAQSFAANFIHASQKVCSVCRQHVYPYTGGGGVSQYQCIIVVMDYGKSLENNNLRKAGGQIEFNFSYYSIIWILFLPQIIIRKFCFHLYRELYWHWSCSGVCIRGSTIGNLWPNQLLIAVR